VRAMLRVFAFDVVSKAMLAALALALIRVMPAEEYARYTLALAAISFATQTFASTFNRIYIVGYERLGLHGSASAFLGFQLLAVGGAALLALPFQGALRGMYLPVVLVTVVTCFSEFAKTAFQQELRFARFTQVELARSALTAAASLGVVALAGTTVRAWQILGVQAAAMALVFFVAMRRRTVWREVLHPRDAARLAMRVVRGGYRYLFGYFALLGVLSQLDVFMLAAFSSPAELATYGSAFRYYSLLSLALAAVHAVLLPLIQRIRTAEEQDQILSRQWRMVAVLAPVILAGAWLSRWIIPFIDGGRYPGAVPVFRVLAVTAVVSFGFSPHAHVLLRVQDFRFLFVLVVCALSAHLVLTYVGVQRAGALGAALATATTFLGINTSVFLRARHHRRHWTPAPAGEIVPPEPLHA
jgi:O-antigen/teichoic acid export membrane protein